MTWKKRLTKLYFLAFKEGLTTTPLQVEKHSLSTISIEIKIILTLGIATAMKQANTPEFVEYQKQVVLNAQRLATKLQAAGYKCVTDGTDNHLVWVDLRSVGLNGARAEKVLEEVSIACNKNTVPGDKSALNPSGIRLGTPALTTRNLKENDMDQVVAFIDRGRCNCRA